MTIKFGVVFLAIAVLFTILSMWHDWLSGPCVFFWGCAAACIIMGKVPEEVDTDQPVR
ncbi:membrane protein [Streptomyces phage Forrest]|uniref:Uncharacterized protein n=2 Tax=Gilsonvirus gilson TaxID=2846398 RepID=A0A3T0ICY5_9CAUD|nr:hypothetical protein HWB98_gp056 [Streptomyces phage Gilson]AZU97273.1 hypothetical protein SEA_GILSON_228 [Streptomyces phage Gilson]QQV92571.1 membrane protein [Streptomyces phage MeganTheeKilla]QZE11336.1 membrane protein [Streptomyces phage Forrest]QZE11564.1 membrane protein [Streptomyces phage Jada]